jgi:hypothetical protein
MERNNFVTGQEAVFAQEWGSASAYLARGADFAT